MTGLVLAAGALPGAAQGVVPSPGARGQLWDPAWGTAGWGDAALLGVSGAIVLGNLVHGPREDGARGPWLFDDSVRDALRVGSERGRRIARDASDVTLAALWSYPVVIDALGVAGWYHGDLRAAREMVTLDAEVLLTTLALQRTATVLASRERPYGVECGRGLPALAEPCAQQDRYYSFFSGHTSLAFAAAATLCWTRLRIPLHGRGQRAWPTCLAGFGLASGAGLLRIAGDMHYSTDVIVGAVVGTTVGFALPWLLRYRKRGRTSLSLSPTPDGAALGLGGAF